MLVQTIKAAVSSTWKKSFVIAELSRR